MTTVKSQILNGIVYLMEKLDYDSLISLRIKLNRAIEYVEQELAPKKLEYKGEQCQSKF